MNCTEITTQVAGPTTARKRGTALATRCRGEDEQGLTQLRLQQRLAAVEVEPTDLVMVEPLLAREGEPDLLAGPGRANSGLRDFSCAAIAAAGERRPDSVTVWRSRDAYVRP